MTPETALVLSTSAPAVVAAVVSIWTARSQRRMKAKVDETHHATTVNSHASDPPTLLDRLADLTAATQANTQAIARVEGQVADVDDRLGQHLSWSEDETKNLWQGVTEALRHVLHPRGTAANDDTR